MAPEPTSNEPSSAKDGTQIRLGDLAQRKSHKISLLLSQQMADRVADELGLRDLRKARLNGRLDPVGRHDWDLHAELGATVTQECVATLADVVTRIDTALTRKYRQDTGEAPQLAEVEMPEDDSIEPLPEIIDLLDLFNEELSLALPPYPRADQADLGPQVFTEPGKTAMRDEDAKPFAGLAALKNQLNGNTEDKD